MKLATALTLLTISTALAAQQNGVRPPNQLADAHDSPPLIHYMAARDPQDRRIDDYIGDWRTSTVRLDHGVVVLRDLLSRGDNLAPPSPGAVLEQANFIARGELAAGTTAPEDTMHGQQEVLYILDGEGTITAAGKTNTLRKGIAILIPEGLAFTLASTGRTAMTMYVLNEPTPHGFKPRADVLVHDVEAQHYAASILDNANTLPGASEHWGQLVKLIFRDTDGLATLTRVTMMQVNPMSMVAPHQHARGQESVVVTVSGESFAFLGTELRPQTAGMAFLTRPDLSTTHSTINVSKAPAVFFCYDAIRTSK